jgi:PAS domain S-box-containing protein
MFTSAALHPVAYFAILAAIFSYLYAQYRQLHLLLWGLGWAALAIRQLLATLDTESIPLLPIDVGLVLAAGILVLIGGMAFSGNEKFGFVRAALFGGVLGVLAAAVFMAVATAAPRVDQYRAASLCVLVASWVGTGWLVDRYGRRYAPTVAPIAGLSLAAWGLWLPLALVLEVRADVGTWPSEIAAALGGIVAAAMAILAIEEARTRAGSVDPRRFLEEDPNMVAVLQDRRIVYANPAFLRRLGWQLVDLRRIDSIEIVAPEFRDEAASRRVRREQGERIPDYEIELVDSSGERMAALVHADPIEWDGRPALKYELVDMTPRRLAEAEIRRINAELRRMNAELEHANQLQSEFLSNTTHELKTPLTSIMANTEILEYEMCGPVNADQRRVLANIGRNSQNLLEMISRLLDFARHRSAVGGVRFEDVNTREILEGVAETVRPLLEEKCLALQIDVGEASDSCWIDGEKIYRVYLNLVENAIKFSTRGTIRMSAKVADGELQGEVVDEGIGIPEERLEDIFHAFTQVDASSTRAYPGVGLGLAICKQLIEMHGGRIWVESIVGEGSAFRFRVPCTPPVLPVEEPHRA